MGIELELAVLLVLLVGAEVFAPFEERTPAWRRILKWSLVCGLTLGLYPILGHLAAGIPLALAGAGLAFHFVWCRRHGIHPLRATPRRRYYELRGWRWEAHEIEHAGTGMHARSELREVQPVLPSRDVSASIAFYVERLGFRLAFSDSEAAPRYAGLRRDSVEIHVQWHDSAEWSRVERPMLRFVVPAVDRLFEDYRGQGVFHSGTALRKTAWGTLEFAFYDPDGNGLTFYRDRT